MSAYDRLFESGNKAQLEKLKENEHKKGFDNIKIGFGIMKLSEEVNELANIFYSGKLVSEFNKNDYKCMRREAADIANFAHMIILKCDKELES